MTMPALAAASGCLSSGAKRRGHVPQRAALSLITLFVAASMSDARAESYVGIGVGSFDGPDQFDARSRGFDIHGGWQLREHLAIEAGLIDQEGDIELSQAGVPWSDGLVDYRWRALHIGPRFSIALGPRWQASAGIALAHVSLERELLGAVVDDGGVPTLRRVGDLREDSLGVVGTLGIGYALTSQQQLRLDYRRLDAGLSQRCEGTELIRCDLAGNETADGLTLIWSVRFR
jgi:hypothetical protein